MFKLRLTSADEFFENYHQYAEGLKRLIDYSTDNTTIGAMTANVLLGKIHVWTGTVDGEVIGFVMTRPMEVEDTKQRYLLIYALYGNEKFPELVYSDGHRELDAHAKVYGCTHMEMQTIRGRAFEKVLAPYGWTPKCTTFKREVV